MKAAPSEGSSPFSFDLIVIPVMIAAARSAAIVEVAKSPDPRMVAQAWTFAA